ncbi:MAG: tRNA 2-thiocytidine biosynthesis TtcA family protein [Spirochaetota bacterium]
MPSIITTVSKRIDKAIFGYRLIRPGDRILVGLSGGKDSVTLAHQLAQKARGFSIPFEVAAVHIRTEYADLEGVDRLRELADELRMPFEQITVSLEGRLKPGRKMNCYWCSTQRRTELLRYAQAHGYTRIALGHHMDDILETFLMNLTHKGEISTMLPALRYDKYPQWVIRPLAWVTDEQTEAYAREIGFEAVRCRCGYDTTSRRKRVRRILDTIIEREGEGARRQMMEALHNVNARYMPEFAGRDVEFAPEHTE